MTSKSSDQLTRFSMMRGDLWTWNTLSLLGVRYFDRIATCKEHAVNIIRFESDYAFMMDFVSIAEYFCGRANVTRKRLYCGA